MNDPEVRVRCLEVAVQLAKPQNIYHVEGIVEIATMLYTFTQAPPPAEKPVEIADKPKRGRPAKAVDILS